MNILTTADVETSIRELFVANRTSLGIEIPMPVMLPDGGLVTICVQEQSGQYLVHDSSCAVMALASLGHRVNAETRRKFASVLSRFHCEMEGDRVQRVVSLNQVAAAAVMVSNAARSIADTVIETRRKADNDFRNLVADKIKELAGERARHHEEVKGASGRTYHVQHVILDRDLRSPLAYVEPLATRSVLSSHFTQFFDVGRAAAGVTMAAIYNEASDIRPTDEHLLQAVGTVMPLASASFQLRKLLATPLVGLPN